MMFIHSDPDDGPKVFMAHMHATHMVACRRCRHHATLPEHAERLKSLFDFVNSLVTRVDEGENFTVTSEIALNDWEGALIVLDRWMVCNDVCNNAEGIVKDIDGVLNVLERILGIDDEQHTLH